MHTSYLAGCFTVLLMLSAPTYGGQTSGALASIQLSATSKTSTADYSKEPYVFEFIETDVRYEPDGKGQRDLSLKVRIQSESAVHDFGLLTYAFASRFETLDVVFVRVHKPDGTVLETPISDVQEIDSAVSREAPMYTDQREKHIAVKSLAVGDTLEAHMRWTVTEALAPGHFWYADSYFTAGICLQETIKIDLPAGLPVKLRNSDPQPSVQDAGGRRIYTFTHSNLKHAEESKIPDWEKNTNGAPLPDLELSSFTSWAEVGAWYNSLQQPKIEVTPEIRAKAEELTKGNTSDDEKLHAIYDFVSTRFRYIGVDLSLARYTPHSASDVLTNRYGDCKDKHTLFAALLRAVGINAYPALISSSFKIDPAFSSPSAFDHVITAVPRGDSFVFLDTTPEVAPFGLLLSNLRDRQALVMPDSSPARLVTTPAESPIPNYEHAKIEASLSINGTLDAKMRFEDRGDSEVPLRLAFRNTPENQWQELTQKIVAALGFGGTVSDVSVAPPEDTGQPFWFSFTYHRTDYPEWKNHRFVLPSPPIVLPPLNEEQKLSKRALPLGPIQDVMYDSLVKLPKGLFALPPQGVDQKSDFAEYTATYSNQDGALHGVLHFKSLLREVPGAERSAYDKFSTEMNDSAYRYIPVVGDFVAAGGAKSPASDPMPSKLEDLIPYFEQQVSADPNNTQALSSLSLAYCSMGRAKDAVALLEKIVSAKPEMADKLHLALGEAYLALPDEDKAMGEFKPYLAADPTPQQLNRVGYDLADANVRLSDALAYSTRAISSLDADSMKISADDLSQSDFRLMPELAANWDTLGWIYFRMGNYPLAEKHLEAAWELDQAAAIGEHLVEIYEKLGKTAKASVVANMTQALYSATAGPPQGKLHDALADETKRLHPLLNAATRSGYFGVHSLQGQVALVDMRSLDVVVPNPPQADSVNAVFAISFSGGKVEKVAFLSGSPELKRFAGAIASAKYFESLPDDTPARIIRKATFNCSRYSKHCTLFIATPEEAIRPVPTFVPLKINVIPQ